MVLPPPHAIFIIFCAESVRALIILSKPIFFRLLKSESIATTSSLLNSKHTSHISSNARDVIFFCSPCFVVWNAMRCGFFRGDARKRLSHICVCRRRSLCHLPCEIFIHICKIEVCGAIVKYLHWISM